MIKKAALLLAVCLTVLILASSAQADGSWNIITPGGATRCADGSPYRFLVHYGATNRLLIYFQGGGACWDTNTCINLQVFDSNVGEETGSVPPPVPEHGNGIFNLADPRNPFTDYTIVYVPYCSADFHTGNRAVDYPTTPGNTVRIEHRGAVNAGAALNWIYRNLAAPTSIFMAGCSAGGPAAVFHAPFVAARYPRAPLVVFNDSAGGYRGDLPTLFSAWGTANTAAQSRAFAGLTADTLSFEALTDAAGAALPGARFAEFNATADQIQAFYLSLMGTDAAQYEGTLLGNLLNIHTTIPNFRSYTVRGDTHCITPRQDFYTMGLDGAGVRDWVAALASGDEVWNVYPPDFPLWFESPAPG